MQCDIDSNLLLLTVLKYIQGSGLQWKIENGTEVHRSEYFEMVMPNCGMVTVMVMVTKQIKCRYRYIKHTISHKQKSLLYLQVGLNNLPKRNELSQLTVDYDFN